ncbi:MAG: FAD-binding protein [Proteobacteria bacterium]|nr:FAD-binding protein [Pseudomonadota bacterium]
MKISRRAAIGAGASAAVVAAAAGGVVLANREAPEPPAPPAIDAQGHLVWRNWSGIQHGYPQARIAPASEDELSHLLKTSPAPIRAVGAGHSFMPLVPTDGTLLTLDSLSGVTKVDGDIATIWAGTRLGELGPQLAKNGRAMANLPDINKQSLGGALGTATHGTGKHLPAIHADVTALRLATVDGQILECSAEKNAQIFDAARVSLGSLGIITQVQLKTSANKRVHRRVWLESFDEALSKAEARWNSHRNFEFYAVPFTGLVANITHDETDEPARPRGEETDSTFLDALKTLRNLLGFSNTLRKEAAELLLGSTPPEEAIDEGWKLLSTDRPVRFNEMEFHLPAEVQLKALREVVETIERERSDVFFPIEVRRIAPDDAWLSPFQGEPRGSVAVHAYYKDDYKFFFELIEPIFRKHGGRPHWGKLNALTGSDFAGLYPRWKDFAEMRRQLDPQGRLLNGYLRGIFGA